MKVTVSEEDKLRRKLQVEVPLSEVEATYEAVYAQLRSNIRVHGFRPGKYPRHLAEKRFQSVMEGEAMQTLVPKYYEQALEELKLRSATEPKFDNLDIDKKKPFKFDVEFEIVPEVKLLPPEKFKLTEKKVKVTAKQVDDRVEEMRNMRATYADKGAKAAAIGDAVTFDFQGTLDGEPFDGGSGENQRIEVGSGQYLPEFDAAFNGIKPGESKTFPLTFPEDYGEASLAGKPVDFSITAKLVEEKIPVEMNKEFFAQFGAAETLEDFKEEVKTQLSADQEREAMQAYHEELTEQIRKAYSFDVPETLIEGNLAEFEHRLSHDDPEALKDEKKLKKLKGEEEEKIRENIRVAYVIDALARGNDIKANEEEVRQRFFYQAYMMQQDPQALIQNPMGRRMLMQIEQSMITTSALEHLAKEVLEKGGKAKPKAEAAKEKDKPAKDRTAKDSAAKDGAAKDKATKPASKAAEKSAPKAAGKEKSEAKPKSGGEKTPARKPKTAKEKA